MQQSHVLSIKNELKFNIYDDNGFMNYDNTLLDDDMLTYKPFMTEQKNSCY